MHIFKYPGSKKTQLLKIPTVDSNIIMPGLSKRWMNLL